ncbi:MAG: hypothetical protein HY270_12285 [Deltaproteobacteria bacterium]|nr:hypothetical protein [Deltaproteobacteria bacterium]
MQFRQYDENLEPETLALNTATQEGPTPLACLQDQSFVVVGAAGSSGMQVVGRRFGRDSRPAGEFLEPVPYVACGPAVMTLGGNRFVAAWDSCERFLSECTVMTELFQANGGADCSGDCDGDGAVTIDEIVYSVNLTFDSDDCFTTTVCPSADTDLDCQITVSDVLAAVNRALEGCE